MIVSGRSKIIPASMMLVSASLARLIYLEIEMVNTDR